MNAKHPSAQPAVPAAELRSPGDRPHPVADQGDRRPLTAAAGGTPAGEGSEAPPATSPAGPKTPGGAAGTSGSGLLAPPGQLERWPKPPRPEDVYIHLTLDLDPVPKGRPRVSPAEVTLIGGRRIPTKKAHGYTPARTAQYEETVGWLLKQARVRRNDTDDLGVHAVFYVREVRDDSDCADFDNLAKSLLDAANGIAWADDRQVTRLTGEVVRDSRHPRIVLAVYVAGLVRAT